jgi:O-antigen biosynthesis protein
LAFIYDTTIDPNAKDNSHAATLDIVGYNKRVLEVGCATGYFTKVLRERGCDVVGIELDPEAAAVAEQWAERVVVGNLDSSDVWDALEGEQFDAVTFGDVLEHLRDPLSVLRSAVRYLKPSGIVAISVPNIAHGDVRMALLRGDFPYRETGLLDQTHIHFFTKESLRKMIKEAGLILVETRRMVKPLFQTELEINRDDIDQPTINSILQDPEAETYQFVVKAVRDNGTRTLATLAERVTALTDQAQDEVVRTAFLRMELQRRDQAQKDAQKLRDELDKERLKLERAHASLHAAQLEAAELRLQIEAIMDTKAFRTLAPLRSAYGRARRVL